jgi:hypothetical protein
VDKRNIRKSIGFRPLTSELHLRTAAIEQTQILAFMGAELLGSGTIDEITEDYVKIRGEYYLRETCQFTVDLKRISYRRVEYSD